MKKIRDHCRKKLNSVAQNYVSGNEGIAIRFQAAVCSFVLRGLAVESLFLSSLVILLTFLVGAFLTEQFSRSIGIVILGATTCYLTHFGAFVFSYAFLGGLRLSKSLRFVTIAIPCALLGGFIMDQFGEMFQWENTSFFEMFCYMMTTQFVIHVTFRSSFVSSTENGANCLYTAARKLEVPEILNVFGFTPSAQIIRLQSFGHYVELTTDEGKAERRINMSEAIILTQPEQGIRVHRSHWVSNKFLGKVVAENRRSFMNVVGEKVNVSRDQRDQIESFLTATSGPPLS